MTPGAIQNVGYVIGGAILLGAFICLFKDWGGRAGTFISMCLMSGAIMLFPAAFLGKGSLKSENDDLQSQLQMKKLQIEMLADYNKKIIGGGLHRVKNLYTASGVVEKLKAGYVRDWTSEYKNWANDELTAFDKWISQVKSFKSPIPPGKVVGP